jgi:hypothetical protein
LLGAARLPSIWRTVPDTSPLNSQPLEGDTLHYFMADNGKLKMGILPVSIFCSGHTYFVQRLAERLNLQPYAVHATFQFSGEWRGCWRAGAGVRCWAGLGGSAGLTVQLHAPPASCVLPSSRPAHWLLHTTHHTTQLNAMTRLRLARPRGPLGLADARPTPLSHLTAPPPPHPPLARPLRRHARQAQPHARAPAVARPARVL